MCAIKNLLSKLNTERYKYENCCYMYLFHLNTVIKRVYLFCIKKDLKKNLLNTIDL